MRNKYVIFVDDAQGKWVSTSVVPAFDSTDPDIKKKIDELFNWFEPGSVSKVTVADNHGSLFSVTYDQWRAGVRESRGSNLARRLMGEASILGAPQPGGEPAFNSNIPSGDSHINAQTAQKDASELPHDDEETRELKIADTILKAAHGMAKTPDVEEIIRQAEELKRIHGVQ